LHFALLRLELIELIRSASTAGGSVVPALTFATDQLAPRGAANPSFLADLEKTMALLAFPLDALSDPLRQLIDPELRRSVAKRVNDALLDGLVETGADGMIGNGCGAVGPEDIERVRGLLRLIQWGEQTAKEERIIVPTLDVAMGNWQEQHVHQTNGHDL
jgi:glucose-induced degradation protein 8